MHTPNHSSYRLNPATSLHWATWDDEYVVFDEGSGRTHQMDSVRAFVLNSLYEGVQNFDKLLSELTSIPSLTHDFHLIELLEAILNEFRTHGLVEVTNE